MVLQQQCLTAEIRCMKVYTSPHGALRATFRNKPCPPMFLKRKKNSALPLQSSPVSLPPHTAQSLWRGSLHTLLLQISSDDELYLCIGLWLSADQMCSRLSFPPLASCSPPGDHASPQISCSCPRKVPVTCSRFLHAI